MKKYVIAWGFFLCCFVGAFAQMISVSGKVTDVTNHPLEGAAVVVKNDNILLSMGTLTDIKGEFRISAKAGEVIRISYLGMKSREFTVSAEQPFLKVHLEPEIITLSSTDVVATGYQNLHKEQTTSAYTKIRTDQLNRQLNRTVQEAIEGQIAGVRFTKDPFTGKEVPILRGVGTFSGNVGYSPLVVIDDIPTDTPLEDINPKDIESVTVLKDAAATAIYGVRAANGVIVIVTKKGLQNGLRINVHTDLFYTFKPNMSRMRYASTSDLIDLETAFYQSKLADSNGNVDDLFASYGEIGGRQTVRYYSPLFQLYRDQAKGKLSQQEVNSTLNEWRNRDYLRDFKRYVWQPIISKRYNISVESGNNRSQNYASLQYEDTDERIVTEKTRALNLYLKNTYQLTPWLKSTIGVNGRYTAVDAVAEQVRNLYTDYLKQPRYTRLLGTNPYAGFNLVAPINGHILDQIAGNDAFRSYSFNLLESIAQEHQKQYNLSLRPFANLQVSIIKGLQYQSYFQYELNTHNSETFFGKDTYYMRLRHNQLVKQDATTQKFSSELPEGGYYEQEKGQTQHYTFRQQLDFNRTFAEAHNVTALLGFEMRQHYTPRNTKEMQYGYDEQTLSFPTLNWKDLYNPGVTSYLYGRQSLSLSRNQQSETKHRFISFYSTLGYSYDQKYNLTGSVRVDQADMFGADPKYKYRPLWSVGGSWNLHREDFFYGNVVNLLKLRLTYGVSGNVDQTTTPFLRGRLLTDVRGAYPSQQYLQFNDTDLPNPKLRWEKTETTNLGIDFGMWYWLSGSIDLYRRYSSDLLVLTELDPTVGAQRRLINNGALLNKGIEVSLNATRELAKDLQLTVRTTFAYNKNTIEKVSSKPSNAVEYARNPLRYYKQGDDFNSLYAYRYKETTNGYPIYLDENGNPNTTFDANGVPTIKDIISEDALVRLGTMNPTFNGALSLQLRYKAFELGTMFIYAGGHKLRKDTYSINQESETHRDITQRWTATNPTDMPRMSFDYPATLRRTANTVNTLWQLGDNHVVNADYIKWRNVLFSCYIPKNICEKLRLQEAKITAQLNNLLTWCAAGDDIDPETYHLNSGRRALPVATAAFFGISFSF
ncbi:TonB-linked outer membrane protein, SusC/RagA family [Capnocytophaga ochracea F0287]|uniref:TonB-linked outer membrane protein, SusC/RagA family n=1 Tax=Capnocytophaga ochracea F0287 TaxID=873517 RepID=E4MT44_CAPOC|nr:SusC/RagA family TonB-linked outer membrane protein [Capnocytophaga ochracea]EFS97064.1 TonB-linked outer membrane protein, SusC/RagA family [Capnocytophaga ochracea F0287]EJF42932.1 TonB-linked outer membrane protein, SusC/RagA family [Capnocytophaga ochracea str. Holt 25]UEB42322.1 SusC/RagA family TonB-linked outer membrane protein [Capnocytophaga ochracea]